ncbi:unnamed protein product [Bursaphelenchus xylophilus]|uniref:receptor protein-tyrosine kinase n=1 Tax=Bursaphelenchus xylophilus TaxID=6326 RepID=A0A1I7RPU6_BURXY|nr:unnamed protein product [Bursaphelenchus xylophilus]CAG9096642.1 unnamed protein product [Bursaphelenchus xylophilus]
MLYICFIFLSFCIKYFCSKKVYLLNTLDAKTELNWQTYSSGGTQRWMEETYRSFDNRSVNQQAYSTCSTDHSVHFENWLLLPNVNKQKEARLFIEFKFSMRRCSSYPRLSIYCKETLNVYAYGVPKGQSMSALDWHNRTEWRFFHTITPNNDYGEIFYSVGVYDGNYESIYFAIRDSGACSSLLYIQIYYLVCPPSLHQLVHLPQVIVSKETKTVQGTCQYYPKDIKINHPRFLCTSDGRWQSLINECGCPSGYQPKDDQCQECPVNFYSPSYDVLPCLACPVGSTSSKTGSSQCKCKSGHVRSNPDETEGECYLLSLLRDIRTSQMDSNFEGDSGKVIIILVSSLVVVLILCVAIVSYLVQSKLRMKQDTDDSLPNPESKESDRSTRHSVSSMTSPPTPKSVTLFPAFMTGNNKPGVLMYVDPLTYDDPSKALADFANEIPREMIELARTIGSGHFGEVCCGRLRVESTYCNVTNMVQQIVAVKMLHPGVAGKARTDFLMEASIMGQFDHENVVHLVGVTTKTEPVMIITEYMLNGSLDKFLRSNDNGKFSLYQLLMMMHNVASGMKYLTGKGFVHRDLAARNVLVDDRLTCKIADFGLSRKVRSKDDREYTTTGGKIPVRWTAPECIAHHKFTSASDVWSYGIVMWEICSFGERPYWDWSNSRVIEEVKNGFRLPKPMDAPDRLFDIMGKCWQHQRHERPSFTDLVTELNSFIQEIQEYQQNLERSFGDISTPDTPNTPTSRKSVMDL